MRIWRPAFFTLAAIALASCGGGGGAGGPAPSTPGPSSGLATFSLAIPRSASAHVRRPRYVSSATGSVTFAPAGSASTTIALSVATPGCTSSASGLACALTISLPVGTTLVRVSTYAAADGSGMPLSTTAVSVTVVAGAVNSVAFTLDGVVASLAVAIVPAAFTNGIASSAAVTVNALDAAGKIILAPGAYVDANDAPLAITLSNSDTSGATHLSTATVTAPTSGIILSYNGAAIASATIGATAPGLGATSATVAVDANAPAVYVSSANFGCVPGANDQVAAYQILAGGGIGPMTGALTLPQAQGPQFMTIDRVGDLFVLLTAGNGPRVVKYALGSTGTPAPNATISGPSTGLSAAGVIAADSAGGVWVAEPKNGTSAGMLAHFAAGANGNNVVPDRTITGIAGLSPALTFEGRTVALDSHDNVYTTAEQPGGSAASVYELPASSSGIATPISSFAFTLGGARTLARLAVDQHNDHVWVWPIDPIAQGFATPPPSFVNYANGGVAEYLPGNTTPARVFYGNTSFPLTNQGISNIWYYVAMAFDAQHNAYVQYEVTRGAGGACASQYVSVFGPAQGGDVTPLQNTSFGQLAPLGIAIR